MALLLLLLCYLASLYRKLVDGTVVVTNMLFGIFVPQTCGWHYCCYFCVIWSLCTANLQMALLLLLLFYLASLYRKLADGTAVVTFVLFGVLVPQTCRWHYFYLFLSSWCCFYIFDRKHADVTVPVTLCVLALLNANVQRAHYFHGV